jgi:hypothetical protein
LNDPLAPPPPVLSTLADIDICCKAGCGSPRSSVIGTCILHAVIV